MRWLLELFRALFRNRRASMVRPWALLAPVVVLLITLPLIRPLRHPDPTATSDDELALLGTIQAVGEQGTLALDRTDFKTTSRLITVAGAPTNLRFYASQPPAFGYLLGCLYRLLNMAGISFSDRPKAEYFLILFGSTIPAAVIAGFVYRMGRLFELPRPRRAALAIASVLGTGVISYATYLNPHVASAALVITSAMCLIHLAISQKRPIVSFWLFAAGASAALAAVVDPSAIPFFPLLLAPCFGFRWAWYRRLGAVLMFLLGGIGPLAFHLSLTVPVTGDPWQGIGFTPPADVGREASPGLASESLDDAEDSHTLWRQIGQIAGQIVAALVGNHGLLSHFPILVLGGVGVTMVMHRHWPMAAKILAAGTLAGGVFLIVAYAVHRPPATAWGDAMFAARWFIVFGPVLLFWSGAWLRRLHGAIAWTVVGVLLAFSVGVGLVGAASSWPREGFQKYTATEALTRLVGSSVNDAQPDEPWRSIAGPVVSRDQSKIIP